MPKRIAIVTESFLPQVNGVTGSVIRILETFKQKELDALVIAPTAPSPSVLGFPVITSASLPLVQFAVGVPGPAISRSLESFSPELIHVAAPFLLGAQALAWGKRNKVPTVAVYQTDVAGYLERYRATFARASFERLVSSIHNLATLNLAPTQSSQVYLQNLGVRRVKVWGRGVDQDLFNPTFRSSPDSVELRRTIAPNGELIIGTVGRLAAEKQIHRMQELLGIENAKFLIVGEGPERANLETTFAGHPVEFLGLRTGLELSYAYGAMDIFVHFGTEETFGQTIQEAQASGLPVVAPNRGGPREIVTHGVTGLLVDPGIPGCYRLAVETLQDEAVRQKFGLAGFDAMRGKSWASNNGQLLDFYLDAAALVTEPVGESLELA